MFGEGLAQTDLRRARAAVDACDLFLALGTIATIEPVSSFPIAARKARAHVIAITHEEDSIYTVLADEIISAAPGEVLPILALALLNQSR
jgi:NAD-dependent SIR2 family protein deacetylase